MIVMMLLHEHVPPLRRRVKVELVVYIFLLLLGGNGNIGSLGCLLESILDAPSDVLVALLRLSMSCLSLADTHILKCASG